MKRLSALAPKQLTLTRLTPGPETEFSRNPAKPGVRQILAQRPFEDQGSYDG